MIDEKLVLDIVEKNFLSQTVACWKKDKKWYERNGMKRGMAGNLSKDEIEAVRKLIKCNLITMKLIPSVFEPFDSTSTSFHFNNTNVSIPLPIKTDVPLTFDLLFKPTRKGLRHCFLESL